jgi:hypothetical protein
VAGMSLYSLCKIWYLIAKSIKSAIKQAAMGVKMGRTFKYMGSISPMPPKILELQIKILMLSEYSATHDSLELNFSLDVSIIINPDAINAVATMPCKIQIVVFIIINCFKV